MKQFKIVVFMDEDVLKSLESNLMMKKAMGNLYGLEDEFVAHMIKALRDDKCKNVTLSTKKNKQ